MIGITSYGAYLPRLRLERMSIYQAMGWFAPATVLVAQGNRSFCNWDEDSLTMAVAASRDCLKGMNKKLVDAVYACSTTFPFADRQNAGIIKTALTLSDEIQTNDFTSSQKAGTSGLVAALQSLASKQRHQLLVTATDKRETRTAGFHEMWFGDGAASLLLGEDKVIAEFLGSHSVSYDFVDHYRGAQNKYDYLWEERWTRDAGYSKIIPEVVAGLFSKLKITIKDVDKLVFPCFFKAEHQKISKQLGATPDKVIDNLHDVCGETGCAHPLMMMAKALEEAKPGDRILLIGYGQGADALYFKVTDAIRSLPPRMGFRGSEENKNVISNYPKFLKFRDLIKTEMGIRAEAPTQTAMTTLWRKRKAILGLVGGKCTKCGTPQFPKMDICVNPECRASHTQEDYEFAEQTGVVKTYTGDMLAVSVDPPSIYGMVQFEGGGRMMSDFSDCTLENVWVGQPVSMVFRKRFTDEQRGFTGYFWKAVPVPGAKKPGAQKPTKAIRFDGKVAIVTGAGAGLGKVYALELAKRGAKVVVNDLGGSRDGSGKSSSAADAVVKQIKDLGGEAVANYDSVATVDGGKAIVQSAQKAFGRLDILINNAGILRDKTLVKMEKEDWDAVMSVHLHGAYNVTKPALSAMRDNNYGRILVTTSAAGLFGNFGQTNYAAAKMGVVGFMNALKMEGEKYNIKVNALAPIAATRLTEDVLPPDMFAKLNPEFLAPLVLYLSSEACNETGMIFNAGMGFFNRSALVSGPGKAVGDEKNPPTPETIHQNWEAINSLAGGQEFQNVTASLGQMAAAFAPASSQPKQEASGTLTTKDVFEQMPKYFRADKAAGVNVVFLFKLSGSGGGDWNAVIKDGACKISSGAHDSPTTTIKMSAEDFVGMVTGKVDAMQAYSSGKLKIEGDLMKSQLIQKLFKFK